MNKILIPKKIVSFLCVAAFLSGCSKPEGVSEIIYSAYNELAPPKILYSCTINHIYEYEIVDEAATKKKWNECKSEAFKTIDKVREVRKLCAGVKVSTIETKTETATVVNYVASKSALSNYNKIFLDAKADCSGNFKLIEGEH
jgi:hypothetical protein